MSEFHYWNLIIGQITKDILSMRELHNQLIEQLGGTEDARQYVNNEFLGNHLDCLNSILAIVKSNPENLTPHEFAVLIAQIQVDLGQMEKIYEQVQKDKIHVLEYPEKNYENYIEWEYLKMEAIYQFLKEKNG